MGATGAGYRTRVKLGGTPTAFSDEVTTVVAGSSYTEYQLTDSDKRVWSRESSATPVVKVSSVIQDSSLYSLDYLFGKVSFNSGQSSVAAVTISGEFIPVGSSERVSHCNGYSVNLTGDLLEDTGYKEAEDSSGAKSRVYGLDDADASLRRFEDMSRDFKDALDNKESVLLEIQFQRSNLYYRGWYIVETHNFSGDVTDLENVEVNLKLDNQTNAGDAINHAFSS